MPTCSSARRPVRTTWPGSSATSSERSVFTSSSRRHEKVEEIRRQIADGTYETPDKIQVALDRLLDELSGFRS